SWRTARRYSRRVPSTSPASCMSWIIRFLSSDIVIPFRVWGPKNSSHNGRKSKGITPDSFGAQPPPSPHNPPSPLPPSRGEAASSNGRKTPQKGGKMATFAGTCYVAGYGATPLLSCDCVNCHQISAERHIATTIYSLRTCVENMVPQTFKKTQIDKAFRIATPK